MNLYAILDKKAGYYGPLMQAPMDGQMVRQLQEMFKQGQSNVSRYPEDFDLYCLGEYDELSGRLDYKAPIRLVVNLAVVLTNGDFQ